MVSTTGVLNVSSKWIYIWAQIHIASLTLHIMFAAQSLVCDVPNTNVWTYDFLWFVLLFWDKTMQSFLTLHDRNLWELFFWLPLLIYSHLLFRRRELHLSESAGTRRTLCAVVVDPRLTICRSPPAASVATPRSARGSVSDPIKCFFKCTKLLLNTLQIMSKNYHRNFHRIYILLSSYEVHRHFFGNSLH